MPQPTARWAILLVAGLTACEPRDPPKPPMPKTATAAPRAGEAFLAAASCSRRDAMSDRAPDDGRDDSTRRRGPSAPSRHDTASAVHRPPEPPGAAPPHAAVLPARRA